MLAYRINPLTVPSVTVRLRRKSNKTKMKPTTMIGIIRSRYISEQVLQLEELKTVLRPC